MSLPDYYRLFTREHAFYAINKYQWRKNHAAYSGGKSYVHHALIEHLSEIPLEYDERVRRAYYFNYPRKIARLITQYVLATRPDRTDADADLCEDWSRTGLRVDEVMRQACTMLNIFGSAWLSVDMPTFIGVKSKADELREKLRPYVTALSPLQVCDWCYGADGELDWVLAIEKDIDNSDPYSDPVHVDVRKLWTRNDVTIVTRRSDAEPVEPVFIEHGLGKVPFIRMEEVDGYGIGANHWFDDVVSISDAILNNESEAQMNTVKQMFGLLVVGESFANGTLKIATKSGNDDESESIASVISRSAALIESPEDKGVSRYISPSGVETATIRSENQNLMKMMFECAMLSTSKDTRMVESAEAKLWDFQSIEQYMKTRADMLEQCEYRAWELMNLWMPTIPVPTLNYNRNFSVLELKDAVSTLLDLSSFNAENDDYQKEINKTAVTLLNRLRQLSQDKAEAITDTIDASSPSLERNTMNNNDNTGDVDNEFEYKA